MPTDKVPNRCHRRAAAHAEKLSCLHAGFVEICASCPDFLALILKAVQGSAYMNKRIAGGCGLLANPNKCRTN